MRGLFDAIRDYMLECEYDIQSDIYPLSGFNNKTIEREALTLVIADMLEKVSKILGCASVLVDEQQNISLNYVMVAMDTVRQRSSRE